ncbi:MAG: hypothetical protein KA028_00175 [Candidatus Pacebacteria bacterium]|nr:hypothetical protein [Candidatus Paceibacterota bacterium]
MYSNETYSNERNYGSAQPSKTAKNSKGTTWAIILIFAIVVLPVTLGLINQYLKQS